MKRINKILVVVMIFTTLLSGPKALGWWNLIYSVEYETDENEEPEIKFFFIEWIKSIRSCKKR